jgi:hypothetical protein
MRVNFLRSLACVAGLSALVVLGACQGNIGGGSGLSIPQAPGYGQPAGPQGGGSSSGQSRERVLDGAVYVGPKLSEVPLPVLDGFGVTIALGTPGPAASPGPTGSAGAGSAARAEAMMHRAGAPAANAARPVPSTSPSPSASSSPSASPAASASATASAAASPSAAASRAPSPSASGPGPKITTKTTIYPDDAPGAPTPVPTGEVQTFVKRSAIVRGFVQPEAADVPIYGLGAIRFTVPSNELLPKRGFTIALFQSGKHNHDKLIAYDTDPAVSSGGVASALTDPIVLKKGIGYLLLLYGDETAPTPAPVAPGYPSPGNNPFPTPTPTYNPANPPGYPYGTPTPYNPYATPTPYNPYATPTPFHM